MKMEKEEKMTTADPKATKETVELWNYLHTVAGKQIITGQHTQTIPCEEIDYIRQVTGKEPKLRGFELLGYSPNINYADASPECLTEIEENYMLLLEATNRLEENGTKPAIPMEAVMADLGISEKDLEAEEEVEIE